MNSRLPYAILVFFILLAFVAGAFLLNSAHPCTEKYKNDKTVYVNGYKLQAQLAVSDQQRTQGLSGKSCLPQNQGMLFEFKKPGYYGFWMKDMKFNIDILWLDDNRVVSIESSVSPSTYPKSFVNDQPANSVLELKAGQASQLNIGTGTKVYY